MIPTWTFPDNLMRDPLFQWQQSQDPDVLEAQASVQRARDAQRIERIKVLDVMWDAAHTAYFDKALMYFIKDDPGFLQAYVTYWEETERGRQ